ncbi:sensor histidine kinase [Nocardia sp. NPDC051321]|uniref:sensor histidine kinase n=1 Tax=Nocardia sp. NPDC051321 TaxID=3364323 RepID=UPI0037A8DC71
MPMPVDAPARPPQSVRETARLLAANGIGLLVQLGIALLLILPWRWIPASLPAVTLFLITAPAAAVVLGTPLLTRAHRRRFRCAGLEITESAEDRTLWSTTRLRQLGYHVIAGPLLAGSGIAILLLWIWTPIAGTVLVWMWLVPTHLRPTRISHAVLTTGIAMGALFVLPMLTRAWPRADRRIARLLLAPSREEQLAHRVDVLTETRAGVVDAADAERRRIERDLHDGVQQRLVSLAVNLGIAKASLTDLPEEARKVIEEAHVQAKEAVAELRQLVRGLHPAVLEDRGLDAALSGLANSVPVPVEITVHMPFRPPPTVEAAAYFVISEALTNVVKHAEADRVEVIVECADEQHMRVLVRDNGVGGAAPATGSGLAGLAKRVASVDGALRVTSPHGGPTVLVAEFPCAR